MRSYLNIIPFIFYVFFNALFSIFHTEPVIKMSNSPDFQGSLHCSHLVGSVSIILFDCLLGVFEKKDYYESEIFFITI